MKTTTQQEQVRTEPSRPVHQIRLASIRAAIWRNQTETGGTRFSAQISRLFKDKDGDTWKSTDSFGRDDLLLVAKVADQTNSWIHQQEQQESGSKQPPAETTETPVAQL